MSRMFRTPVKPPFRRIWLKWWPNNCQENYCLAISDWLSQSNPKMNWSSVYVGQLGRTLPRD